MTQADILKYMKKNNERGFTTRELNKILNFGSAHNNLRVLYLSGDVKRVWVKTKKGGNEKEYLYSLK